MLDLSVRIFEEGVAILFLALLNFVSYEGALKAGLVFDDHLAIENNPVCNSSAVPITTYVYPDAEYSEGRGPKPQKVVDFDAEATDYPEESPHSWKAAWYTDFWGNSFKGDHTHLSYRPITTLTYRFDHWMTNHYNKANKPRPKRRVAVPKTVNAENDLDMEYVYEEIHDFHDPYRLHLVNIVLQVLNTVFFFSYLCRRYLKASFFASVIASALFAVHPVHVESVTGIVGRAELLCLFFGLIAFNAYFKYHPVASIRDGVHEAVDSARKSGRVMRTLSGLKMVLTYALFVVAIALGCLSKETGITVSAICLAYDFMLMWSHYGTETESTKAKGTRKAKASKAASYGILEYLTSRDASASTGAYAPAAYHPLMFRVLSLLTIIGFLQGRKIVLGGRVDLAESGLIRKVENPFYALPSGLWRKVSFTYLHAKNLQLLLWPYEMCCEYGFDCIPAFTTFYDPRVLGIVATFAFLAYVGLHCFRIPAVGTLYEIVKAVLSVGWGVLIGTKKRLPIFKQKFSAFDITPDPSLCLASFWLLAPYLPVSHLLVSVGTNIAERCLYLPSVGICLLVACLLHNIEKALIQKSSSKAKKSEGETPQQPRSYSFYVLNAFILVVLALGVHKTRERTLDWQSDKALFESSVRVCPRSAKNNNQLGLSRWNEGRIKDGKDLFEKAASIFPEWSEPHFNLARYFYMTQDIRRAFFHLERCVTGLFPKEGCIQMYFSTFSALFPNPNATQVFHTGEILEKIQQYGQAASQYRQAGLRFLQSEKSRKGAEVSFQNALRLHESGKITADDVLRRREQQGDKSIRENGDLDSRCNVLYWLGVTQMYQQNILGFCHHLHTLIRSCADDPVDRITAMQGVPILMQQMPMLVQSPHTLRKLEKGYGRSVIVAIFGQWIDTLYMCLQGLPLHTQERSQVADTLAQAALDMTRLTFTSDELAQGAEGEVGQPVFDQPEAAFFLEEDVSHLGTERVYGAEVPRVLRDALYMSSDAPFGDDGLPTTKEDARIFGTTARPVRFNASDFARSATQNVTHVNDSVAAQARRCAIYPALAQANWRVGDIDESDAVLDRCLTECVGEVTASTGLNAVSAEDIEKYSSRIRASGAHCQAIRKAQDPSN